VYVIIQNSVWHQFHKEVSDSLEDDRDGKCALKKVTRLIKENHVEKHGDPFMNKVHQSLVKPWLP
jgi:hypothetical protein